MKTLRFFHSSFAILISIACAAATHAAIYNYNQDGIWSNSATWVEVPPNVSSTFPGPSDSIVISGQTGTLEHGVRIDGSRSVVDLSFNDSYAPGVSFRPVENGGNVILSVTNDISKSGSGYLILRAANNNGGLTVNVTRDVVVSAGGLFVGTTGTGVTSFSVGRNTTITGGLLSLRIGSTISLGNVSVSNGGTLQLYSGSGGAITQTVNMTGLSGAGDINTTNSSANLFTSLVALNQSTDSTFSGTLRQVSSNGNARIALTKLGVGTLTLSGENTFSGAVSINDGAIKVASLGGVTSSNLGIGTTLALGNLTTTGKLIYTGTGETSARTISLAGTTGGGIIQADGTGALNLSGNIGSTASGSKTLTLTGSSTATNQSSGIISNFSPTMTTAIAKTGVGRWAISGVNTYSGGTSITAGTLEAGNSSAFGTGSVQVQNVASVLRINSGISINNAITISEGAKLEVNGTVTSSVAFGANGGALSGSGTVNTAVSFSSTSHILAPGNSPGTLGFGTSQNWSAFNYQWELNNWNGNAGTFDTVFVDGILTLSASGTYQLDIRSLTNANASGLISNFDGSTQVWTILEASSILNFDENLWTINTAGFSNAPTSSDQWSVQQSGNALILSYTAVPEPGVSAFIVMGSVMIGFYGIRRRSKQK